MRTTVATPGWIDCAHAPPANVKTKPQIAAEMKI
jgi:hypothetical protein